MLGKCVSKRTAAFYLICFSLFAASAARADFQVGGTIPGHNGYNYAPSVISTPGLEQFWWCGEGYANPVTQVPMDYIYYQYYSSSSGWSPIYTALTPTDYYAWDGQFTCDPSVV